MRILAIDTSTTRGSVALLDGDRVLLDETFIAERSHESELMPLLQRARDRVEKFDIIAVGLGPGSYAGIRIAIATGMGLQMALGARLVGIPSVAALETSFLEAHFKKGYAMTMKNLEDLLAALS